MEISDIRIKLIQDASDRLKAVCSITLDDEFVVRDLKVVEGTNGLFVAMPSRKLSVHCPQCRGKNHLRARFCNECGAKLPPARVTGDAAGRLRMHRDIAHPINPTFREIVQNRVIEKYRAESELAKSPDYAPVDIDADYEEKVVEIQQDSGENYAPSEYDQLIAGLNKGAGAEPPRERERDSRPGPMAPGPRAPRQNDRRRSEHSDRPARPARHSPPRQTQRGDGRRSESPHPPRGPNPVVRPAQLPSIMDEGADDLFDEVDGNIAPPEQKPPSPVARRPSPPSRRVEERPLPRRSEERPPARRTEDRPAPRPVEDLPVARRVEDPPVRREEAPLTPRPAPPPAAPKPKPGKAEDLPFGAGL